MKKILLICFLIIINGYAVGQNVSVLDQKNGFKTLKFGTVRADIKDLKFLKTEYGVSYYLLEPQTLDLYYVFEVHFHKIILGFKNDKLMLIALSKTENFNDPSSSNVLIEDLKYLHHSFCKTIGESEYIKEDSGDIYHRWYGETCKLSLSRIRGKGGIDGEGNPFIDVTLQVIFNSYIEVS
ncbi:hypothetical protein LRS05_15030 [Flavobacterium sp. J372]|uniref:hypothetical protein n=1 Tax=Flavobacterium sp. J372 TaxID=2898436 RepID=UPI002150781C|nr:hypothetical protein [Flavobacterium sp. J372]MCR5863351.1 hypothetical protein [Flavobacterium sp. J372]